MLEIDLNKLIQNIFIKDLQDRDKMTNTSEITTIMIKSLLPDERQRGNKVDYKRFKEELSLWKYYMAEEDEILKKILEDENTWDYFSFQDESLYTRIIPIIVANPDYTMIEKEGIKNLLFTTGSLKTLWNWIASMKIISNIIEGRHDIVEDLKKHIINFSQLDFIHEYENFYRFPLKEYPGNFNIQFERERINLLNILNDVHVEGYCELKDLLAIVDGEDSNTLLGNIIINSQKNIDRDSDISLCKFYENLNEYVIKLRKSRIDPENLRIDKYDLPDIFAFQEGEVFFHSLIKDGKVIKKEVKDNVLTSLVQTRSGMYLFKRDPF